MSDLLKWKDQGLKSPLARARGLGSSKEGVHEWINTRITSIAGLILLPWFVCSMLGLIGKGSDGFVAWLEQPLNALMMSAFTIVFYVHAKLGIKVIIEDYVHDEGAKIRELVALELLSWSMMFATLFCILKIAFTAGLA